MLVFQLHHGKATQDAQPEFIGDTRNKETIAQTSVFAGLPSMTRALELAGQVFDENKGDA